MTAPTPSTNPAIGWTDEHGTYHHAPGYGLDVAPIEGTIVDDTAGIERFCQGMVESATEFDWNPGHPYSLPDHLRDGLRAWATEFRTWDRNNRGDRS